MKSSHDPFSRLAGVLVAAAALAAAFSSPCFAADADPKPPAPAAAVGAGEKPGFDVGLVDKSVKPCNDFFQFACGGWLAKNPVPPEYAIWGRFNELADRNQQTLKKILEGASAAKKRDAIHQKIGDFYASCMDEGAAEAAGAAPLAPEMERIAKIQDVAGIAGEIARLQPQGVGVMFRFDATPDFDDARNMIAEADQGGLGLPDRDYYTKDDERSKKIRDQYTGHVEKMFALAGDSTEKAKVEAAAVMQIETELAKASMTRVERRDPKKRANRKDRKQLADLAPTFPWKEYFVAIGQPDLASLNVGSPQFFQGLDKQLQERDVDAWRSYLRWHLLNAAAPMLSSAFVNEEFQFNGTVLTGAQKLQPRWKRCVAATDRTLRDTLGRPYVEAAFGAQAKRRMNEMVQGLQDAMKADLSSISWMDDETKARAQAKLAGFARKIGYPDKWVDYGSVKVDRASWLANHVRAREFLSRRDLDKIGKPVDRTEWRMTPPTVNASYSPQRNEITFPAGILQPPFFDNALDDAPNYGGIGGVIGHEISHGFDDQGRQFDKDGNLKDWWSAESAKEFVRRASCVDRQFSNYVSIDDVHVNGKLTLGENIGDLGGLKIAHAAFVKAQEGKKAAPIGGYTPDQRFFLGWAQVWCSNVRPEEARLRAATDPHAPSRFRVIGPLSNMPEFKSAFDCQDDTPMVRPAADVCTVW
ncbi:MAG: M13 family metallopeptidase [Acidobacteriota bacterium]|nr:M13 family metallopeptidase [Acidobacteriota bacterium]